MQPDVAAEIRAAIQRPASWTAYQEGVSYVPPLSEEAKQWIRDVLGGEPPADAETLHASPLPRPQNDPDPAARPNETATTRAKDKGK